MKKDDGFYLRTSPIDRANFKAAVDMSGLPVSEIIRMAVSEFLEAHRNSDFQPAKKATYHAPYEQKRYTITEIVDLLKDYI